VDTSSNGMEKPAADGGLDINFKRILSRILRYWYIVVLSIACGLTIAYLFNRYSTRIFPVKASIIIYQSEENAGAKFLYNNELVSPYRNYLNELYIMRSYPLLRKVVEELNFDVSFYREGNIKTTEYYDSNFPVEVRVLPGGDMPYGRAINLKINANETISVDLLFDNESESGTSPDNLSFGDTLRIDGFSLAFRKIGDVNELKDKAFIVRFNDPNRLARKYAANVTATWAQVGASVVNLEVKGEVPQKEVNFLSKFIEKYQEYDVEKKNKMATMAIDFLDSQIQFMGDTLNMLEDRVESFKHRNVVTNLGSETNRLYMKMEGLEEQRFQFRLKENYYDYIVSLLTNEQYDGIFTPASVGVSDNVISGLIADLIETRANLNTYQGIGRRNENPLYQVQQQRIRQIKDDILKTIQNTRKTEAINIQFINNQIREIQRELAQLPGSERELTGIERDYTIKENLYVFLLQKRTEAGLSKASTTSDIVVVNPPLAGAAVSPKEDQNYLLGLGIGLVLPLLGFVLAEVLNNKVQSRDDIEKITSVPIIGGVGHNPSGNNLIVVNKPRSAMAESFRALRSNLNYFTDNRDKVVFMVTSSIPSEGKSFTTLNLATVLAMAGKRTIIIGADLRKPKLYGDLGLHNDVGLSQYLSGMATKENIIQETTVDNLYLISGGPMPPNPSELLIRPAMDDLIKSLREDFTFIVMDTPPLSLVADAFVLSKFAQHTLFVVRQDFTPRDALNALNDFYETGKLSNISILFNDLRKSGLGYGYGYGGYGYGYGYTYGYGFRKSKTNRESSYYSD
jgi:capsular exopolysaccharide synthesis family protein